MKAFTFILILASLNFSCSANFREPICENGDLDFPPEHYGVYRANVPEQTLDGSYTMADTEFYLGSNAFSIETGRFLQVKKNLGSKVATDLKDRLAICKVGGKRYIQVRSDAHLYSFYQMDLTSNGINISLVSVDMKELKAAEIPAIRFPTFSYFENLNGSAGGTFNFSFGFEDSYTVVDNRTLSPERVVEFFRPGALSVFVEKIADTPESWKKNKALTHLSVGRD